MCVKQTVFACLLAVLFLEWVVSLNIISGALVCACNNSSLSREFCERKKAMQNIKEDQILCLDTATSHASHTLVMLGTVAIATEGVHDLEHVPSVQPVWFVSVHNDTVHGENQLSASGRIMSWPLCFLKVYLFEAWRALTLSVAVLQAALGSNHRPELVKPTRGNMHYSSA
jgi:hypothetical protein